MAYREPERRRRLLLILAGLALLLSTTIFSIAEFYTDLLWFSDLGHVNVVTVRLLSAWATGLVFGVFTFVLIYVNLVIARRMAPRAFLTLAGDMPEQLQQALVQLKSALEPVMRWVLLGVPALIAVASGLAMASQWQTFRLAISAPGFGVSDAQFGRDVAFFVFTLPALRVVSDWLTGMLVVVLLLTVAVHIFDGAIRPWERLRGFAPHVKAHLSVLAGLIVLSKAFDYWIRTFELDFSPRGQVLGASYADVHAQLPALYILIVIALLSGIVLMVNLRFQGWRLPAVALGIWVSASVLIGSVYPALVQQFRVAPNEIALEAPYISRNIEATRRAFGLDEVETRPFEANANLTQADVSAEGVTLENARLWDPVVMQTTYKQLQEIRPYYDFRDVDIDRYRLDGRPTEVLISVREMNVQQLAETARTWVNQHLVYTHGYGAVVSPVNEVEADGTPSFIVRDIPPSGSDELTVTRPGVYFGEATDNYAIAGSALEEFDFPQGADNAETSYRGETGVPVGGLLRKLAFALRFRSTDLMLSSYVTPESKVLFGRNILQRVGLLAPFLTLDSDPYPAIIEGRLVWIVDGYTTSDHYPYSQRASNGTNYIRNSVKATVDAYDGTVRLYAFDENDPILTAWRRILPGLVEDSSAMPDALREHLRYPEGLFLVQAEMYRNYHMLDPRVFYNKEDSWEIPEDGDGGMMRPFYVLMRLPGEQGEDFVMMMPFTPRGKANMIGWMAARSDPERYGQRLVYQLPKQRLVLGPQQVRARINQEPTISQQLSLWNQRGSQVLFGNLLVLPVKESIVYVQPLYLQAQQTAIPQLTRVIVAYGNRIAMEPDLDTALTRAFGFRTGQPAQRPSPGQPQVPGAVPSAELAQARELYERALAAQREGDWATYGRLIAELGTLLEQLAPSTSATGAPEATSTVPATVTP